MDTSQFLHQHMAGMTQAFIGCGCVIFGGYPRDILIRDHNVMEFTRLYKPDLSGNRTFEDDFFDETVLPETAKRLILPKDLDVFLRGSKDMVECVLESVKHITGFVVVCGEEIKKYYNLPSNVCGIRLTMEHSTGVRIMVDFVYSLGPMLPPFGICDFTCNTLLYDHHGIRLSPNNGIVNHPDDISFWQTKIISEILQMRTERCLDPQKAPNAKIFNMINYRTDKMREKGWTF